MRYLNKIAFIESAAVKYAEINLDGNVHLIGTQGVGKSTLLRALLFFYNANQQKLGISTGKKNFTDFYFPYQNSYIVYEVARENGLYCILLYKSQGRVCYRFLNAAYDKKHFINTDGEIRESWEKIRMALGANQITYSRKIDKYEEYRNILYGNNKGLPPEFRKYAILESKQYQNIPRAIQHVFLNYKVESDFIKDTIIKSLNDEEIIINLAAYTSHLKKFDTQLADIRKWLEKTRSGEVIVRKQADEVIRLYHSIHFNQREAERLANELVWKREDTENRRPACNRRLEKEEEHKEAVNRKQQTLATGFKKKENALLGQIMECQSKLKEIKKKTEDYERQNIHEVLTRASHKKELELEKTELNHRKQLLEANYKDISQKYEAETNHYKNQLATFRNSKMAEITAEKENLFRFKDLLSKEYTRQEEEIKETAREELQLLTNLLEEKKEHINRLKIHRAEIKHTRFYEKEIENHKTEITRLNTELQRIKNEVKQLINESETVKRHWELEKQKAENSIERERETLNRQLEEARVAIETIDNKLAANQDSLYGWLNKEVPGWENTIGKVIDEENVLFHTELTPQKKTTQQDSFYGIEINLDALEKTAKTVSDYEREKKQQVNTQENIRKKLEQQSTELENELDKLKKKYKPKLTAHKSTLQRLEYDEQQYNRQLAKYRMELDEWLEKAKTEKQQALETNNLEKEKAIVQQEEAAGNLATKKADIQKKVERRQKEKQKEIAHKEGMLADFTEQVNAQVKAKEQEIQTVIRNIQDHQQKELHNRGADTEQLAQIMKRMQLIEEEINYIENHRKLIERYQYDKEELFDKAEIFKSRKTSHEIKLAAEKEKYTAHQKKLNEETVAIDANITAIKVELAGIQEDMDAFDSFADSDPYRLYDIAGLTANVLYKTETRCKELIHQIYEKYAAGQKMRTDLQAAVNKFTGNFSDDNIFTFKTKFTDAEEYLVFAGELKEFMDEDMVVQYENTLNALFADIIKHVGRETTELLSKEGMIQKVITDINKDFVRRNFAGVIDKIEMRLIASGNKIVHLLTEIKKFNDDNIDNLGEMNLFSSSQQNRETSNRRATELLSTLSREIANYKHTQIRLTDSFELEFKVVENGNDTGWVQNLANVGSDGTDVLVKAMINIMLLNVFKEGATKNRFKDFRLHCMMDEIGKLHPTNIKGILKFANDRNIFLINGSPQSFDATIYRYTYKLSRRIDPADGKSVTIVNRLITSNRNN